MRQLIAQIQFSKSLPFSLLALVLFPGDADSSINSIRCRCVFIGKKLPPHLTPVVVLEIHDKNDCTHQFLIQMCRWELKPSTYLTLTVYNQSDFSAAVPQRSEHPSNRLCENPFNLANSITQKYRGLFNVKNIKYARKHVPKQAVPCIQRARLQNE